MREWRTEQVLDLLSEPRATAAAAESNSACRTPADVRDVWGPTMFQDLQAHPLPPRHLSGSSWSSVAVRALPARGLSALF